MENILKVSKKLEVLYVEDNEQNRLQTLKMLKYFFNI